MLRIPDTLPARPLAGYRILVGLVAGAKALELGVSPLLGTRAGPLFGSAWCCPHRSGSHSAR